MPVVLIEDDEPDVEVRIGVAYPFGRDEQLPDRPDAERSLAVTVVGDEHDVLPVARAVYAVRGGDQQVVSGAANHARGAVVGGAALPEEQRSDPQRQHRGDQMPRRPTRLDPAGTRRRVSCRCWGLGRVLTSVQRLQPKREQRAEPDGLGRLVE